MKHFTDAKWIRKETLAGGVEVAISDASCIVGVCIPGGNPFYMYADQFETLRTVIPLIQAYTKANEDRALPEDRARDLSAQLKAEQRQKVRDLQTKAAKVVKALTPEALEALLKASGQ